MCEPTYKLSIVNDETGCYAVRNRITAGQIMSGLKIIEKVRYIPQTDG